MLTYLQALILGAMQGASELFPISSLGHTVLVPPLLGWTIDQHADSFLIFVVATHFATSLVLLGFFWKDWVRILRGLGRSLVAREIRQDDPDAKLGWLLIVATIPAGLLGLLFEESVKRFFASPATVATFLLLNAGILFFADRLHRRLIVSPATSDQTADARIAKLSWLRGLGVGCLQALALFPGISRTGSALTGGLLAGLSQEDAARFSFLLATPIIGAAAVLKLPELLTHSANLPLGPIFFGMAVSAITAYLTVRFLTRYFKHNRLSPFAWYCLAVGVGCLVLFHGR